MPIYSIIASKDAVPQLFWKLAGATTCLGDTKAFWCVVLLFAKCTNKKLLVFLHQRLSILLDPARWQGWLDSGCESELAALEKDGGFKSCTTIGNGQNVKRAENIMHGMHAILQADAEQLKSRMHDLLQGRADWGNYYVRRS